MTSRGFETFDLDFFPLALILQTIEQINEKEDRIWRHINHEQHP